MRLTSFVDLSHPLGDETDVYPGDPEVRLEPHATIAADGFNLLAVRLGSQSGTHVDAPFHFAADGARVDELPLALFCGPAERPMGGYVALPDAWRDEPDRLSEWIGVALEEVAAMPPKVKKPRAPRASTR